MSGFHPVGLKLVAADPQKPDPYSLVDWSKPSKAVVANNDEGNGCVLHYAGPHLDFDINEVGVGTRLDDLGLDDAPAGISIWEGVHRVSRDYYGETDCELDGAFREPTDKEWECIRIGVCPWDVEDWLRKEE